MDTNEEKKKRGGYLFDIICEGAMSGLGFCHLLPQHASDLLPFTFRHHTHATSSGWIVWFVRTRLKSRKTHGSGIPLLIFFNTCFSTSSRGRFSYVRFRRGAVLRAETKRRKILEWPTRLLVLCAFPYVIFLLALLCIYRSLLTHWLCFIQRDLRFPRVFGGVGVREDESKRTFLVHITQRKRSFLHFCLLAFFGLVRWGDYVSFSNLWIFLRMRRLKSRRWDSLHCT